MRICPKCGSKKIKKNGVVYTTVMSKAGKKKRRIQNYKCGEGHLFNFRNCISLKTCCCTKDAGRLRVRTFL